MSESPAPPQTRFGGWIPGIVLIALGLIFLARAYGGLALENWWALFILIPAFSRSSARTRTTP